MHVGKVIPDTGCLAKRGVQIPRSVWIPDHHTRFVLYSRILAGRRSDSDPLPCRDILKATSSLHSIHRVPYVWYGLCKVSDSIRSRVRVLSCVPVSDSSRITKSGDRAGNLGHAGNNDSIDANDAMRLNRRGQGMAFMRCTDQ